MPTKKEIEDRRAPMPSAPMKYLPDGSVNWGDMWDSYCILALEGGPPHRGTMLNHDDVIDTEAEGYKFAVQEIIRGVDAVSGLEASEFSPGWIGIKCASTTMVNWLVEAILEENVEARAEGATLLVPVAGYYTIKGEIKNVITAVAKTTHYWGEHVPTEVKQTLAAQAQLDAWKGKVKNWFSRITSKNN